MFARIDNGFVDDLALEGEGKTLFFATPTEVGEGLRTQIRHGQILLNKNDSPMSTAIFQVFYRCQAR
jgi:hypothetical protein